MPFVSETYSDLRDSGPVVDIFIAIPRSLSQKLIEGLHEPPSPVRVAAMIDTGADITVVEPGIMESLAIKATGVLRVSSVAETRLHRRVPR
jgi:hypothetical protein